RAEKGDTVEVVTERTPFYGEAGGQVGDKGAISGGNAKLVVEDAQKLITGLVIHRGQIEEGALAVGDAVELMVDHSRREAIRRNHSAPHLLEWALRQVIGSHAQQKGSVVGPDRLRFDFTHTRPLG